MPVNAKMQDFTGIRIIDPDTEFITEQIKATI